MSPGVYRTISILPIVLVLYATYMAHALLQERELERQSSLLHTGDVIVINTQPKLEAAVFESRVVESVAEAVIPEATTTTPTLDVQQELPPPTVREMATYIEIVGSCAAHFEGDCVNARTKPATTSPSALKIRNGVVLASDGIVEEGGMRWHRIVFNEWVRYPERLPKYLYVAEEYGAPMEIEAPSNLSTTTATTSKHILVDRSEQKLYAYDEGDELFMEETISTGLDATPTPRGTFTIFSKTPSRYMQGPLPGISGDYYDLPGVPWNMYFTEQGGALHGAYWHDKFGRKWSHGCVNLPPDKARELYHWADLGTKVIIRD